VSLPLNKYRKVEGDFCSDQGATKEHSLSYATEKQRRCEQKDQDLVCSGFSGNDTGSAADLPPFRRHYCASLSQKNNE